MQRADQVEVERAGAFVRELPTISFTTLPAHSCGGTVQVLMQEAIARTHLIGYSRFERSIDRPSAGGRATWRAADEHDRRSLPSRLIVQMQAPTEALHEPAYRHRPPGVAKRANDRSKRRGLQRSMRCVDSRQLQLISTIPKGAALAVVHQDDTRRWPMCTMPNRLRPLEPWLWRKRRRRRCHRPQTGSAAVQTQELVGSTVTVVAAFHNVFIREQMRLPNPDYGSGISRRRVRVRPAEGAVSVDIEDSNHAFRLVLRHDGARVVAVESEAIRYPLSTCSEAQQSLQRLVGQSIDSAAQLREILEPRLSCTHLSYMAGLALTSVKDDPHERLYDIAVEDERDGRTRARIYRNDVCVHDWQITNHSIVEPAEHAGQTVMKGFYAWARIAFQGALLEAAVALQRGYFVAQSRRYQFLPAVAFGMPEGVCYSYSTPIVNRARLVTGSMRDFTNSPDALLRFDPPD